MAERLNLFLLLVRLCVPSPNASGLREVEGLLGVSRDGVRIGGLRAGDTREPVSIGGGVFRAGAASRSVLSARLKSSSAWLARL